MITAQGLSDVGCKRDHNEDAIMVSEADGVFCVADGMGGLRAGEIASGEVVKQLRAALAAPRTDGGTEQVVGSALRTAHEALRTLATTKHWLTEDGRAEIGTTASALVCDLRRQRGVIHHIGDSRIYRLRGDEFRQLTTDHNLESEVRRKLGAGQDTRGYNLEMAGAVLTQALGFRKDIAIDELSFDLAARDVFLLCSDGLNRHVSDEEIRAALQASPSPAVIVEELVERTKSRGAEDNVSVIVLRLDSDRALAVRRRWRAGVMALAFCLLAVGVFGAMSAYRAHCLRELRQGQLEVITMLRSPAVQASQLELLKIRQAAERALAADPAIAPQLEEFMLRWRRDLLREYRAAAQDGIAHRDWQRLGALPPLSSEEFPGLAQQSEFQPLFAFSSHRGELERLWWQMRNALKAGAIADIDAQAQRYWAIVGELAPEDPSGALLAMKLTAGEKRLDTLGALLRNWPFGQDMNDVKDALTARLNEERAATAKDKWTPGKRTETPVLPPAAGAGEDVAAVAPKAAGQQGQAGKSAAAGDTGGKPAPAVAVLKAAEQQGQANKAATGSDAAGKPAVAAAKDVSGVIHFPLAEAKPKEAEAVVAPPVAPKTAGWQGQADKSAAEGGTGGKPAPAAVVPKVAAQQRQDGKPAAEGSTAGKPAVGAVEPQPFAGVLAEFRQRLLKGLDYASWRWLEEQRPTMSAEERDAAFTAYMDALTLRAASIKENHFAGADAFVFETCAEILANLTAERQAALRYLLDGLRRHYAEAGEESLRNAAKSGAWAEAVARLDANPRLTASVVSPAGLAIAREWQALLAQWRTTPAQAEAAIRDLRDMLADCRSPALLADDGAKAAAANIGKDGATPYHRYLAAVAELQQRCEKGRALCREHLALLRLPIWDKIGASVSAERVAELKERLGELREALASPEAVPVAAGDAGIDGVLSPTACRERLRADVQALREMETQALAAVALLHAEMTKQEELSHRVKQHAFVSDDTIFALITVPPTLLPSVKIQALCRALTSSEP